MEKEIIMGIYKIENINTHKVYIGQAEDIYKRWKDHKRMLKNNKHHSCKLQKAYNRTRNNKEEIFQYSIVEVVEYKEDLFKREKYWMDYYNSLYDGYNCADIGKFQIVKNNKAKEKKLKTEFYYNLFTNIFNPDYMHIGRIGGSKTWMGRIQDKHYAWASMKKLCNIIEWYNQYNTFEENTSLFIRTAPTFPGHTNAKFIGVILDENMKTLESYRFGTYKGHYMPEYNCKDLGSELTQEQIECFFKIAKEYTKPIA